MAQCYGRRFFVKPPKVSALAFQAAAWSAAWFSVLTRKPIDRIRQVVAVGAQLESGAGAIQSTCERPLGRTDQSPIGLQDFGLDRAILTRLHAEPVPCHGCTTVITFLLSLLLSRSHEQDLRVQLGCHAHALIDVHRCPQLGQ